MKRLIIFSFFIIFLLAGLNNLQSQQLPRLTHNMSPEEAKLKYLIGKDFIKTSPPDGDIRNIAEFDQMEGVLIRYPFGIEFPLIAALSEQTMVTTIVASTSQQNSVLNQYESNDVNTDNCNFMIAPTDSYWTRDYGPWYIAYGDDQIGIVDFPYNRPRPYDNNIPQETADFLGLEWFGMDIITTGGNYMTDGYGVSSATTLTLEENPDLTQLEIDQIMIDYLGVNNYQLIPDPNNTYIDHIDCWGKYLGVDKVLIREVPSSHPQYDEIEATANYFANTISGYGTPYRVYRVYTPGNEPYTNSLILNDKVFVPITGSQWDDEAVASYEIAMPGYEVEGFFGSWESTDALHCRTKGIADRNTVFIYHIPLSGAQQMSNEYIIEAEITAYSGLPLNNSDVVTFYNVDGGDWESIEMTFEGDKVYSAIIPEQNEGSEVAYYIHAEDNGGNEANHPFIGEPDPHTFNVQLLPEIYLDITEIIKTIDEGTMDVEEFTIDNFGLSELDYNITWSAANFETFQVDIDDSPSANAYNSNTYSELGWEDVSVSEEGTIGSCIVDFVWTTDNWPEEGSFLLESPQGTEVVIGAGLGGGSYSVELDDFSGEELLGEWRIWIEDTYGDGGHQATDISITFNKQIEIPEWLSVSPVSGSIEPSESELIDVTLDATLLDVGVYFGNIFISSNDPDQAEIDIPVELTVDEVSSIPDDAFDDGYAVYPNPFTESAMVKIPSQIINPVVTIYNSQGMIVKILNQTDRNNQFLRYSWDGLNVNGGEESKGIYFVNVKGENITKTFKILKF